MLIAACTGIHKYIYMYIHAEGETKLHRGVGAASGGVLPFASLPPWQESIVAFPKVEHFVHACVCPSI